MSAVANVKTTIGSYYEVQKTLGEGSFAKVKLCVHRISGEKVAIKCIDKSKITEEAQLVNIHRESAIMKKLQHNNIIRLYEVMETQYMIYLVQEFASGGEVLDYIVAHGRLREPEAKKFMAQIVDALIYCHSVNVCHRDLKAENLLLDEHMNIKISDFGLSNVFAEDNTLKTFCGSPTYSAPELIQGIRYVGPEVDVWSLGVLLYAMVTGMLPFANKNINYLYDQILACKYKMPDYVSIECQHLISKMLVVDPKQRYNMKQVQAHRWLESVTTGEKLVEPRRPQNVNEIDQDILDVLVISGFDREQCIQAILKNEFDYICGMYFVMAHNKIKQLQQPQKENIKNPIVSQHRVRSNTVQGNQSDKKPVPKQPVVQQPVVVQQQQQQQPKVQLPSPAKQVRSPLARNVVSAESSADFADVELVNSPISPAIQQAVLKTPLPKQENPALARLKNRASRQRSNTVDGTKPEVVQAQSAKPQTIEASVIEVASTMKKVKIDNTNDASNSSVQMSSEKDVSGIRSVRFAFNLNTISSDSPEVLLIKMQHILTSMNIQFIQDKFVLRCSLMVNGEQLQFDAEICKLPRLQLHGIRYKRVKGDTWQYKEVCTVLMKMWEQK